MSIIKLGNISFGYDTTLVLEDFNLEIASGEITCLLGSSGCGKTTVLRLIAGLEAPRQGSVFIAGRQVSEANKIVLPPQERKIGFVFQDLALWPHLTVFKNVAFALSGKNITEQEKEVEDLLRFFNLQGHQEKYPHQLSGGQQQMLAIARAMAIQPQILLMDEPLANLDVKLKRQILRHIKEINERFGVSIVYVTHDHKEAFSIADSLVVMQKGRIEAKGSVEEIKRSENEYVRYFLEY
jgi:ABC-type Fe3+/spermidine/putrescine transport system ATPase subunit